MSNQKTLDPDTPVSEACERLAKVYSGVTATQRHPLYRWTQIANDAAVLSEDIRRHQEDEALNRIAKLLGRLLEFVGFGLCEADINQPQLLPYTLLRTEFRHNYHDSPSNAPAKESLSKWI